MGSLRECVSNHRRLDYYVLYDQPLQISPSALSACRQSGGMEETDVEVGALVKKSITLSLGPTTAALWPDELVKRPLLDESAQCLRLQATVSVCCWSRAAWTGTGSIILRLSASLSTHAVPLQRDVSLSFFFIADGVYRHLLATGSAGSISATMSAVSF